MANNEANSCPLLSPENEKLTLRYITPNPPHRHVLWELAFFMDGVSRNVVNGREYEATQGDFFLIGPPHIHELSFVKTPHLHQDVYFTEEEVKEALSGLPKRIRDEILSGKRIMHMHLPYGDYQTALPFLNLLQNFSNFPVTEKKEENSQYAKFLAQSLLKFLLGKYAIRYLENHTTVPKWLLDFTADLQRPEVFSKRVNEIVALTHYSHSQVGTLFRNYKGISLIDYLIEIRMDYAKRLLETTSQSVLAISEDCGYNSLSSFIKLFREKTGCSPLQYRKQAQEEFAKSDLTSPQTE
ncbi:MAG: AraC family transcriptional regulator [bacterium]|nr:AraC family transcriptional regulator [bacterium]